MAGAVGNTLFDGASLLHLLDDIEQERSSVSEHPNALIVLQRKHIDELIFGQEWLSLAAFWFKYTQRIVHIILFHEVTDHRESYPLGESILY